MEYNCRDLFLLSILVPTRTTLGSLVDCIGDANLSTKMDLLGGPLAFILEAMVNPQDLSESCSIAAGEDASSNGQGRM